MRSSGIEGLVGGVHRHLGSPHNPPRSHSSGIAHEVAVASLVVSGSTSSEMAATDRPERFVANQVEVIRIPRESPRGLCNCYATTV